MIQYDIITTTITETPKEDVQWYKSGTKNAITMTIEGIKVIVLMAVWYGGKCENLCDIRVWAPMPQVGNHKKKYIYTRIMAEQLSKRQLTRIHKHFSF